MQKEASGLECGLESTDQVWNTWNEACFRIQKAYSSYAEKNAYPNRFKMEQREGVSFNNLRQEVCCFPGCISNKAKNP